jgi:hypothetical protein
MPALLTPAQLIDAVLKGAPAHQRGAVLRLALLHNQERLKRLETTRLAYVEQGRDDEWQAQQTRTTETLAEIERVLATC